MRKTSHRDYKTWLVWEREQWNDPSRSDHYLMQIAQAIYASKSRSSAALDKFKIPFKFIRRQAQSNQNMADLAKSRWFGITGFKRNKK